jgi:hypothetical protein
MNFLHGLVPQLQKLGVKEHEFDLMMKSAQKRIESGMVSGPEDFHDQIGQMLSMIAYGQAEMMDPEKAMLVGIMMQMEPLKK